MPIRRPRPASTARPVRSPRRGRWLAAALVVVAAAAAGVGLTLAGSGTPGYTDAVAGHGTPPPAPHKTIVADQRGTAKLVAGWIAHNWCAPLAVARLTGAPLGPDHPVVAMPAPGQMQKKNPDLAGVTAVLPGAGRWRVTREWCDSTTNFPRLEGSKGEAAGAAPFTKKQLASGINRAQVDARLPVPLGTITQAVEPVTVALSWTATDGATTVSGWLWFTTDVVTVPAADGMKLSTWHGSRIGWAYQPRFVPENSGAATTHPATLHTAASRTARYTQPVE